MADILEKIAKTEGKEDEISLGDLEKHFDEIMNDTQNDKKQIDALVKNLEANLDNQKYKLDLKGIQEQILAKRLSEVTTNTIKVYQICQILQGEKEIKRINRDDSEIPQEMIADRINVYNEQRSKSFPSETVKYENQKLNIHTLFGDLEVPYEPSKMVEVAYNLQDKSMVLGAEMLQNEHMITKQEKKLSNFFETIDTYDFFMFVVTREKKEMFNAFVQANPDPDMKESEEKITLSEEGKVSIEMKNDDLDINMSSQTDISTMKSQEDVLKYINEQRNTFKESKQTRETANAAMNAAIAKEKYTDFTDADMQAINDWVKTNGKEQPKNLKKVQEKMNAMIDNMMSTKITPKLAKAGNKNVYEPSDIKMIQLWANVCFGEELTLDGNRGKENDLTNIYIWKKNLLTYGVMDGEGKIDMESFKAYLNVNTVDDLMSMVGNTDSQEKIFGESFASGCKQYLKALTADQIEKIGKNQGTLGEKKLFQVACRMSMDIHSLNGKEIKIDGAIGEQGRILLNLFLSRAMDVGIEKKQSLIEMMIFLTKKLDKHNLTLAHVFVGGNDVYIKTFFEQDHEKMMEAIKKAPDFRVFGLRYDLGAYINEYIQTGGKISKESQEIIKQSSEALKQVEKEQEKLRQLEIKQKRFEAIPKENAKLQTSVESFQSKLSSLKKQYEQQLESFRALLQSNDSFLDAAGYAIPQLIVGPTMGKIINSRTHAGINEKQVAAYNALDKLYSQIVKLEDKIESFNKQIKNNTIEQRCLYYEILKASGKQKEADVALVNLVALYGEDMKLKYAADIKQTYDRVGESEKMILRANQQQLSEYMKRKQSTTDIAQQVMGKSKVSFESAGLESITHISSSVCMSLLNNDELSSIISEQPRDNTAVAGMKPTAEREIVDGNILGSDVVMRYSDGKTTYDGNRDKAMRRQSLKYFHHMEMPGMGQILVKANPALIEKIQARKPSASNPNEKLIFQPSQNANGYFDLNENGVLVGWQNKNGDIQYKPLIEHDTKKTYTIAKREYEGLLQVKEGYNNLVMENNVMQQYFDYASDLQQTAGSLQNIAQGGGASGAGEPLSDKLKRAVTKSGGLKDQLTKFKDFIKENKSTLKESLQEGRFGAWDQYERQLFDVEKQINQVDLYSQQLEVLLNVSVRASKDESSFRELLINIVAIVAGVVCGVATGGWGGIFGFALVSTLGGMAGARVAQEFFARTVDTQGLNNDLHSDIGNSIMDSEKYPRSKTIEGLCMEFTQGYVTTVALLGAGRFMGSQLTKYVMQNAGKLTWQAKLTYKIWNVLGKLNSSEVQLLEKKGFANFIKKCGEETAEELRQEGLETGAEKIHPVLGFIVGLLTCTSGGTSYRAGNTDVFIEGYDQVTRTSTVSYVGDMTTLQSQLSASANENGYILETSENGIMTYSSTIQGKKSTIIFKPTQESISMKSLKMPEHAKIYDINHNRTENGEFYYTYGNLQPGDNNLTTYLARNGMILQGTVNEDGSFDVMNREGEIIHFSKSEVTNTTEYQTNENVSGTSDNKVTETVTETQTETKTDVDSKVNSTVDEIIEDQALFDEETVTEEMTDTEQETLVDNVKTKVFAIYNYMASLNGKTEIDVINDIGLYVANNVMHFIHEVKMVFGTQLVNVYKSYVQMKKNLGKPGDAEFQKVFQAKVKERGINLAKMVGVTALTKLGIDPHLFTWSGHLIASELQKRIPFFDKLFGLSFDTMQTLYSRKKGKNTMYNPQTVIENSLLDPDTRKQNIADELGLDMEKDAALLDALQKAHEVGQDGPGKNPAYSPGVYNYTQEQIRQKMEILKPFIENGSITLDQVRKLFELGYLGKNSVKVEINQNEIFDTGNAEMMNEITLNKNKNIEELETEFLQKTQDLKIEMKKLQESDPEEYGKREKEYEKRLKSLSDGFNIISEVKNKYQTKLDNINKQLEKKPNDTKLLSQKVKYEKIQEMLMNGQVLSKRMSVIEVMKTKINVLKLRLNKFIIQKSKSRSPESAEKTQIKIDKLNNDINRLQKEIDIHEMNLQLLFAETYVGIRDLKGLDDVEMLDIIRVYNEHILKPIGFRTIDFYATFGNNIDINGNTIGIGAIDIEQAAEFNKSGIDGQTFASIKKVLYGIETETDMNTVNARVQQEIEKIKNPAEKDMAQKLWSSIESKVNDGRLLPAEKAVIFAHSIAFMLDYKLAYPEKKANETFLLIEANQNKLIHQHVQDKSYLTGSSHDILHILKGNMDMAENFMQNMSPMERVLARQIIIDHDIGYTSMFNKYLNTQLKNQNGKYFDATKDHPLWSTIFVEENADRYKANFGLEGYNIIKNGILSHSTPKTTSLPYGEHTGKTRPEVVYAVTSVVDCAAASADYKSDFLFGQPEIATQFRLVYESMAKRDFAAAEKNLIKIVEIINTSNIDSELRIALLDAVDSMHLKPDADGKIPFQEKLRLFENMTAIEIAKAKSDMIAKAQKDNDPKNLKKVLKTFNKANNTDFKSLTELEKANDIQIKNYVIFDYIDGIVSFPYQKYLAQYGVRISVDKETGKTLIGQENGVVTAQFELAGKTFKNLVEMGGAEFALGSFIKVCEDFNIKKANKDKGEADTEIDILISNVETAQKKGNVMQGLKDIYGTESTTLTGKNGEKVTLKFEGESYGDVDAIIEKQTKLNESINKARGNMEKVFQELEINDKLEQRKVLVADMKSYVADIAAVVGDKKYVVEGLTLSEYTVAIQNKLDAYFAVEGDISPAHVAEVLADIDNIVDVGYFPSLFMKTKN